VVAGVGLVASEKVSLDGSLLRQHAAHDPQERDQINTADPAVDQRAQWFAVSNGVKITDERGGVWAQHDEQRLYTIQHAGHTPERQGRSAERHHFLVLGLGVAPHDLHRVDCRLGVIERVVQLVERRLQAAQVERRQRTRGAPSLRFLGGHAGPREIRADTGSRRITRRCSG